MRRFAFQVTLALMVIAGLEVTTLLPLRFRSLLAIYAIVTGAALWFRRRYLLEPGPIRTGILVAGVMSLLPLLAMIALRFGPDPRLEIIQLSFPTLTGWVAMLALLPLIDSSDGGPARIEASRRPSVAQSIAFLALTAVFLGIAHVLATGHYAIVSDEAVYLTQSRWMRFPELTWSIEPDLAPFFVMRKVGYLGDHLYGMYPPGWPALLAIFRYAGLEAWASVILGTVSVALIYLIGKRISGARTGMLAAVLLATSQYFVMTHAGYMSHAAAITALLAATWCLHRGIDADRWRQAALWTAAGVMLGYVVTVRPLTGLTIGTSVALWMLLEAHRATSKLPLQMIACLVLGGILPAVLLVAYNVTVLGKPLTVGYAVLHPGLYDLGFGRSGVLENSTARHTPVGGLWALAVRLGQLNTVFVPVGLLAPTLAVALGAGFRLQWSRIALFALLPLVHVLYWYPSIRLYSEMLPYVVLGTAIMLVFIYDRWPRMAWGLVIIAVGSQALMALPWPKGSGADHHPWAQTDYLAPITGRRAMLQTADSLAQVHHRVLLFSREETPFDNQIDRLYQHNGARFDGPILVARDLGARNADLMRRFPDRVPFLVEDRGRSMPAVYTRLSP